MFDRYGIIRMVSTRFYRRKLMIMTLTLTPMRTAMGPRKRAKVMIAYRIDYIDFYQEKIVSPPKWWVAQIFQVCACLCGTWNRANHVIEITQCTGTIWLVTWLTEIFSDCFIFLDKHCSECLWPKKYMPHYNKPSRNFCYAGIHSVHVVPMISSWLGLISTHLSRKIKCTYEIRFWPT